MLLDKEGKVFIVSSVIDEDCPEKIVDFSDKRTCSSDFFLFHKTTNRKMYDREYERCRQRGLYDLIFMNEKSQITEGVISNIFIRRNNHYYTPPLECGLLNGVYRRYILKKKILPAREKILFPEDIKTADEIIMTNAVRGMVKVKLLHATSKNPKTREAVYV
jgi:para-aminobenzoate synthetase/4-amino-4-deoxychorismate lyase